MGVYKSLLLFLVIVLVGCQEDDNIDGRVSFVNVGDAVPAFTLFSVSGENVSSASLKGQAYILSFFDTGCPDCRKELPVLQQIYDKYADKVPMFNVPRSQTATEVSAYWSKESLTMPFYIPADKELYYQFATSGIPRTYIVDGNGKVRAILTDDPLADFDTIDSLLQPLVTPGADSRTHPNDSVNAAFTIKVRVAKSDQDYFRNEYSINYLELFFFDSETKKLAAKVVSNDLIQDTIYADNYYDITYIMPSKRVQVGVYNIFAITNYSNVPDDINDQDDFLNLVDSVSYASGIEANIPLSGPIMTSNPTALLSVDLVPWAGKEFGITIEMERVLAKLQIGVAQNSFGLSYNGNKYADVNITNFKLVNLNKQYYLFQHTDTDYVLDPLFSKKTTNADDASRFQNYYVSWFGSFTTENLASMPTAGNYGYVYILENTASSDCQKNGYSAGIVFKAAVSPVVVYMYDDNSQTLLAEKRPEYWPNIIFLYKYRFYGSIQALNLVGDFNLDEQKSYTDSQLKTYGIKQCKFNMGVYETYYTYWIRHHQSNTTTMEPMEYAIVRNNFYKITIAGISGIGNSVIVPDIMRDNYPNSYSDIMVEGN